MPADPQHSGCSYYGLTSKKNAFSQGSSRHRRLGKVALGLLMGLALFSFAGRNRSGVFHRQR
jgi:hypothetical protein